MASVRLCQFLCVVLYFINLEVSKACIVAVYRAFLCVVADCGGDEHVADEGAASVSQIHYVGPKLGTRIVSELKGKMGALGSDEITIISSGAGATVQHSSAMDDAISALSNLGYARIEAGMVVANVLRQNPDANTSELIRLSLKEIGKGSL